MEHKNNDCLHECDEIFKIKIRGKRGKNGSTGSTGSTGNTGVTGVTGTTGTGVTGVTGTTGTGITGATGVNVPGYSPLLFSGWIRNTSQFAFPQLKQGPIALYYTFGLGISNQNGPTPFVGIRGNDTEIPLVLPIQFSPGNVRDINEANDIYSRVPGVGPRILRGLRWSIEYSRIRSPELPPRPGTIIGIWSGPVPLSRFTPPSLVRTILVDIFDFFDPSSQATHFQSGANLVNEITVNGGDYIALVLLIPIGGTPDQTLSFVNASVEISNSI